MQSLRLPRQEDNHGSGTSFRPQLFFFFLICNGKMHDGFLNIILMGSVKSFCITVKVNFELLVLSFGGM